MNKPVSQLPWKYFDELIAWATSSAYTDDLREARIAFFERTGEVFDDDRQLELRMSAFVEHYVCDRHAPHLQQRTPAQARYEQALRTETPKRAYVFRAFTETMHGLFEVRRMTKNEVRLRELFSEMNCAVHEHRQLVGLKIGDVIECRLIPFSGLLYFSSAWCFHPHEAAPLIRAEAHRRARLNAKAEHALLDECAKRSLKAERYRKIAIHKIYDFKS